MTATVHSAREWSLSRDNEGHREYSVTLRVITTDFSDGPLAVLNASGMPSIGVPWAYGNDLDPWALRTPRGTVTPKVTGEKSKEWEVTLTYSTKPRKRCQDTTIEDPLLEPPDISGSFVNYTEEKTKDKDGNKLATSSHEIYRGNLVEFDASKPTVNISLNSATLDLGFISQRMHNVNDSVLWGCEPRCVKLSSFNWARKMYGTCSFYYNLQFGFNIDFNTFDRQGLDEGMKILNPDLPGADKDNPTHFVLYKDANGENTKILLDGMGEPLTDGAAPVYNDIVYYPESNLLELGIPSTF